jgi:excisionase family DNA binding protein
MPIEIKVPDKEIFTVKEIAAVLDVHIATAWRYLERGVRGQRLPSFRIGPKRRRVGRRALLAWLEAINDDHHDAAQDRHHEQRARQDRQAEAVERALAAEGF